MIKLQISEREKWMREYVRINGTYHFAHHNKYDDCPGCIAEELERIDKERNTKAQAQCSQS